MPGHKLRTPAWYLGKSAGMRDIVINAQNVGDPSRVQESSKKHRFLAPTPLTWQIQQFAGGWFKTQGQKHFLIATFISDRKAKQY